MNGPIEPVMVHRNADDLEDLHVRVQVEDGELVWMQQGPDRIAVPLEEFGRFVDNLERIYTGQEPVVATTEGSAL